MADINAQSEKNAKKTETNQGLKSSFPLPDDTLTVETDAQAAQRTNLINQRKAQTVTRHTDPALRVDTHQDAEYTVSLASPKSQKPDHEWIDPSVAKQHLESDEQVHARITPPKENLQDGIERIWGEKSTPAPKAESRLLEGKIQAQLRTGHEHEREQKLARSQAHNSRILAQGAEDEIITTSTSGALESDLDEYHRMRAARADSEAKAAQQQVNAERKSSELQKQTIGAFSLVPKGAEDFSFTEEETQDLAAQIQKKASPTHIIQGIKPDSTPAEPLLSAEEEAQFMSGDSQGLILDDNPYAGLFDEPDDFTPGS